MSKKFRKCLNFFIFLMFNNKKKIVNEINKFLFYRLANIFVQGPAKKKTNKYLCIFFSLIKSQNFKIFLFLSTDKNI